jgi:hypothetical protein
MYMESVILFKHVTHFVVSSYIAYTLPIINKLSQNGFLYVTKKCLQIGSMNVAILDVFALSRY